jgi:hypothetical protein
MDIEYKRVPKSLRNRISLSSFDLSSLSFPVSGSIKNTHLIHRITFHYEVIKSTDYYSGNYQELQSFTHTAVSSGDFRLKQYGDSLASSGCGTHGTIESQQTPWYSRRDWDDNTDVETNKTVVAYTIRCGDTNMYPGWDLNPSLGADLIFSEDNYRHAINPHDGLMPEEFNGNWNPWHLGEWHDQLNMAGEYSMNNETSVNAEAYLKNIIQELGDVISSGPQASRPLWEHQGGVSHLPEYDINRHGSWNPNVVI